MDFDPALKVLLPDPYVYPSRLKRRLAACLDWLGDLWMAPEQQPIAWKSLKRIAVLRLDHLGDLINVLPAVAALKKALPDTQVDLFVGPWGKDVAELGACADKVIVVEASWFARPKRRKWPLGEIFRLGSVLREGDYDLAVDFRGEFRHMLALWLSGTPLRLGHTLSAGRFLLTHAFAADNTQHERERNLFLLNRAGAGLKSAPLALHLPSKAKAEAARVVRDLKLRGRFIAIQAATGTQAKRWVPEHWAKVVDAQRLPVVLLGTAAEAVEMRAIAALCKKPPRLAAGSLSLAGLCAFLDKAALLISVDSGPAHLAAAMKTKVLSLYSATNRLEQWAPEGSRVIQKEIACGPCELSLCPYNNACMRLIKPAEVLRAVEDLLS